MSCIACTSERQAEFGAEMNIHFPGRKGLDLPAVCVFPKLLVCLDCGSTEFAMPEAELAALINGTGRGKAVRQRESAKDVTSL